MSGFKMDDYVDVAERIREFSAKYPDGSLQSELTFEGNGWLCKAYAYRNADDPRPGVGHAFEPVPGKTPYTKDSEAMNAETSAWGRAIVALGFETKKIASRQEVQARHESGGGTKGGAEAAPAQQKSGREPAAAPSTTFKAPESVNPATIAGTDPGDVILTFGKHKGKPIKDVPRSYLAWWLNEEPPKGDAQKQQRAAAELYLLGATADLVTPVGGEDGIPF